MSRYTNYADPTESADRKERFRQAEDSGGVEENAAIMFRDLLPTTYLMQNMKPYFRLSLQLHRQFWPDHGSKRRNHSPWP